MSTAAPLGHTPYLTGGPAGPGRSPGRFFYDFKAILKQNLHITRPTAPRWKALIETCQKTTRKGMSAVQAEGQGVAERTERRAHSPTVLSAALVRWPKESDREKAPEKKSIGKNLRVSVRFVYHQIVLGARSPNH